VADLLTVSELGGTEAGVRGGIGIEVHVQGFAELQKELAELPPKLSGKVTTFALRKAAVVARRGLRATAPERSDSSFKVRRGVSLRGRGFLKRKGIIIRKAKRGPNRKNRMLIGPSFDAFYGQIVDEGHKASTKRRPRGQSQGGARGAAPHPWMPRGDRQGARPQAPDPQEAPPWLALSSGS
jgi:hypothetical protein